MRNIIVWVKQRMGKKICNHMESEAKTNKIISVIRSEIKKLEEIIMTTKAEVLEAIAAEKEDVLREIQALKDQIANGSPVTSEDLDEIINAVRGIHGEGATEE